MPKQLSLFGGVPSQGTAAAVRENAAQILAMSRRSDAETSTRAAERMVASGKLRENQAKVLAALYDNPASTYAEIAEIAGLPQPEPARRLPELRALGLVMALAAEARDCRIRKTRCSVWRLTGQGEEWMEAMPCSRNR
jgi:DNA-binding MarR family transcriptional regulator